MRLKFIILSIICTYFCFSSVVFAEYKFPWPAGHTYNWWTGSGWHTVDRQNPEIGAIDVGSSDPELQTLAMEDGTVIISMYCNLSGFVYVNHLGKTFKYYHLDINMRENNIYAGQGVHRGQLLGTLRKDTFIDGNCGEGYQSSSLGHIHWMVGLDPVVIDGWLFDSPLNYITKEGQYIYMGGDLPQSTNTAIIRNTTISNNRSYYVPRTLVVGSYDSTTILDGTNATITLAVY